jgi:predicted RNA-binding Zn-ribbon protein involved in translation (DUF1610 family)
MMTTSSTLQACEVTLGCRASLYNIILFCSLAGLGRLELSTERGKNPMTAKDTTTAKRPCPDCGAALVKRTSKAVHSLMSKTYLVCRNAVCGATFTGVDEITHRLSPPSQPNPDVQLPYASNEARRILLAAQGLPDVLEPPSLPGLDSRLSETRA